MTPNWQDAVDRYMEELEQQNILRVNNWLDIENKLLVKKK